MNGIAKITVAGQEVGLKFGMPAVRRFFEKAKGLDLMLDGRYTDLGLAHLMYAGYLNYCIMKDQPPHIAFDAFYDLLENPGEKTREEVYEAVRAFEESKFIKPLVDAKEEEEKKKVMEVSTSTKSNPSVTENLDTPLQTTTG